MNSRFNSQDCAADTRCQVLALLKKLIVRYADVPGDDIRPFPEMVQPRTLTTRSAGRM